MKCPICGKELELRNKQIGTTENGDPIFNEYAICRDCRKQWNLDKQRAKKAAAKKAPQPEENVQKEAVAKKEAVKQSAPAKKPAPKKEAQPARPAPKQEAPASNKSAADGSAKTAVQRKKAPAKTASGNETSAAPKRRPRPDADSAVPAKKPVKKRRPENSEPEEEKRYSNIPPERVRSKREKAARKSYEDMLATGSIDKVAVKRKKRQLEDETGEIKRPSSAKSASDRRSAPVKSSPKKYEPESSEYDDDEYYDDEPRFRPMRIILGVISLIGFGYFIYRGFITGLADTTEGGSISSGTTFIVLALCMLVSALLYFIMLQKDTIFAFLLPMVFYLGSAMFAFIQRGDDLLLLIASIASAVLAVISLILAITSRGSEYEDDDDYDEAFEDDYADDDYDD